MQLAAPWLAQVKVASLPSRNVSAMGSACSVAVAGAAPRHATKHELELLAKL